MRRLTIIVCGFGLISASVGCHHTAGRCDCVQPISPCYKYGLNAPEGAVFKATHVEVLPSAEPAPPPAKEKISLPRGDL